jgi:hypothetical protein
MLLDRRINKEFLTRIQKVHYHFGIALPSLAVPRLKQPKIFFESDIITVQYAF